MGKRLFFIFFIKKTARYFSNVIKLSSFKQKSNPPRTLQKRKKGGLLLSDLCYQKNYQGDTSDARYNNDEFIQYTSECFWYPMRFEDSHIERDKSLCLLDLIYYSILLDLSIIIGFLLRCKTSKIMITFKNFSRCVVFCYIRHWVLTNPINNGTLFCLFCISISIIKSFSSFK